VFADAETHRNWIAQLPSLKLDSPSQRAIKKSQLFEAI
jgi:hypothetical protein